MQTCTHIYMRTVYMQHTYADEYREIVNCIDKYFFKGKQCKILDTFTSYIITLYIIILHILSKATKYDSMSSIQSYIVTLS